MLFKRKRRPTPQQNPEAKLRSRTEKAAYQLYQNRLILQKEGDEKSDWELAQKIVCSPVRSALFTSYVQFIQLEKRAWEPLLAWANRQALLGLFGLVGNAGIIVAVITYVGSEKQRRDAEVLNAWQTITNASGQAGGGGRIQALEFLNASPGANWRRKFPWFCAPHPLCVWPAESLDGINLAVDSIELAIEDGGEENSDSNTSGRKPHGVYLAQIQLPRASLAMANLRDANLTNANLQDAFLYGASLQNAFLENANLQGTALMYADLQDTILVNANLQDAFLENANLQDASLMNANLQDASLMNANLQDANLTLVNLQDAFLENANLQDAFLYGASLQDADLRYANLQDTEGLKTEQVAQAKLCFTKLPSGLDLPANRNCTELGVDPEMGNDIDIPDNS